MTPINIPLVNVNLNNTDNNNYVRGYKDGKKAGATEWAGRAQGLVDALEAFILWQGSTLKNWPVMERAQEALAKYKEVSNDKETT